MSIFLARLYFTLHSLEPNHKIHLQNVKLLVNQNCTSSISVHSWFLQDITILIVHAQLSAHAAPTFPELVNADLNKESFSLFLKQDVSSFGLMELAALAYEVRCRLGQPLCKYEHTSGIIHLNLWFISGHAAVFQMTHVKTANRQRHARVSSVVQSENSQCYAFCLPFD